MEIVAEMGPCEGSMEYARRAIGILAGTGISMKVQWYTADTLVTRDAPRYDHTDGRDLTQHEMFQNQLTENEWAVIASEAKQAGVPFFPTVFSMEAVDLAAGLGLNRVKIASGDITHTPLIRHAARHIDELVISTGAAIAPEIRTAINVVIENTAPMQARKLTLLACHLEYPSTAADAHYGRIVALRNLVNQMGLPAIEIGYSDHTPDDGLVPSLLGATMWEKHCTIGGVDVVGDHTFAFTPEDLVTAREKHQLWQESLGPVALQISTGEMAARRGARRGTYAVRDIKKGEKVTYADVEFLRPADGMSPHDFTLWNKSTAQVDIAAGDPIELNQIGSVGASLTVE